MSASYQVYYHGTNPEAAERILGEGFRTWFWNDEDGYLPVGGYLGIGVYISKDWRVALWFGRVLLVVKTVPGTRILDVSAPEDKGVIASLRRKFGNEIFRKPFWKAIPHNKRVSNAELVSLMRYHYHSYWDRGIKNQDRTRVGSEHHWEQLQDLPKLLRRYGYDGFGNPHDEMGFVLFDPTHLKTQGVVANLPGKIWNDYKDFGHEDVSWDSYFEKLPSYDDLTRTFPPGPQFS